MSTVLIVDDDRALVRALGIGLRVHGFSVHAAVTGPEALRVAGKVHPDVVLVDLGLPGLDGIEVIEALRGWSEAAIIVLSARPQEAVKVAALDAGADDYLTKPFGIDELLARVRAVSRRRVSASEPVVRVGEITIDLAARRVERGGTLVHLTPKEWAALAILVRHPGQLITHQNLLAQVWGEGYGTETEYLRTLFARLRRKLEDDPSNPRHLITEPGVGYRLEQ